MICRILEGLLTPEPDVVLEKGINKYIAAYSLFMDNMKTHTTPLPAMLRVVPPP